MNTQGLLISAKGGRRGAESETSRKEFRCRPLCPFSVVSFMPGRPSELSLGNSLHSPGPNSTNFVKRRW